MTGKLCTIALFLAVAAVFLTSCVGIDSRLTILDNGSGTLEMTYQVSQLLSNFGDSGDGRKIVPLPLTRSDFDRSLEAAKGKVRLAAFDRSENEKDITIHVRLDFDSLDALGSLDAFRGAEIKTGAGGQGGGHTFSQLIAHAPQTPVSDDSLRMVDAFFNGYDLTFTVETPQPVKSASLGTVSENHRSVTYTTSVRDVIRTKSDLVLSVSW